MVTIIEKRTEKDPLQHIGENAGICWGADISNMENNIKRAKTCMQSRHLRTTEFPTVEFIIDETSARCIREAYTHIIGVTRLQESTRYVNCEDFKYYNPCATEEQKELYDSIMNMVAIGYKQLIDIGVSKEDSANVLPLGMNSKFVWKINVRALIHFMNERLCSRAYKEIRKLSNEIKKILSEYSDEWKWICDNYFVPKCKSIGYCTEDKCCGAMPKGIEGLKELAVKEYLNKQNNS